MRYVGIDPSTKTGLVILNDDGSVHAQTEISSRSVNDPYRLIDIAETVVGTIAADGKASKTKVFIESFAYSAKGQGVSVQYGIGWMIRAELVKTYGNYTEINPSAVKKFATGKGNSAKNLLMKEVYKRWGFESDSDNIVDAYVMSQIGRYLDGLEKPTKYQEDVLKAVRK